MPRSVPFIKATACGNDFLLIEGRLVPAAELRSLTRAICDRHYGAGADGVEWLFPTQQADIEARLINSDGSDAEVSGNGTRCVAALYAQQHGSKEIRILTGAGVKTCTLTANNGMNFEFRSDMGEAYIEGEKTLELPSGPMRGLKLSVGNPQFVGFVDQFEEGWQRRAAEVERHREFPSRTNVELVKVINPHEIEIRIFERGAGETLSSGTGSCAAATAAIHAGRAQSPVKVTSPGGSQTVEWNGRISLTGPARIICQGEFYL
jgi:diaminopimelate epimerase